DRTRLHISERVRSRVLVRGNSRCHARTQTRRRLNRRLEAAGARRLRNEVFFSAPQRKRTPLGASLARLSSYRQVSQGCCTSRPPSRDNRIGSSSDGLFRLGG